MRRRNQWQEAPEGQPGGPGASGPGEAGYDGEVTVGEDAGTDGFGNPEGWSAADLADLGKGTEPDREGSSPPTGG